MAKVLIIDVIRHGEVAGRKHVARGRTDNPLSDEGWRQLQCVKQAIGHVDQIATSPLKRCRLFAESCSEPMLLLSDMQEIDFGDWEDKAADEVAEQELLSRFFDDPSGFQAPNGEAFDVFKKRVIAAWESWLQEGVGEHRILLAHGCVIRVLLAYLLDIPSKNFWNIVIDPAGWTRISCLHGEKPRVLFINRDAGVSCKD